MCGNPNDGWTALSQCHNYISFHSQGWGRIQTLQNTSVDLLWLTQSPFIRLCPNYVTFRKQNNFLVIAHGICGILILVILLYDLGKVVLLLFDGKKLTRPVDGF